MQEMGMQMADVVRQFRRQHQRLTKAADAVGRRIASQIGEPEAARAAISRRAAGNAASHATRGAARDRDIPADRECGARIC